jgi:hypothetical protein
MQRKVIVLLILLLFGFGMFELKAQIIKGEAILGMNLSQVDGDEVYGFKKVGANVGAGVMIPIGGNWDVSLEALFSQKGANQKPQYKDSTKNGAYKLNLNYAEVPVLVMYTDKEFISAGAGFSWGRLVGVKEWEHSKLIESTTVNSGIYSKNDFSILGDLRIRIYKQLKFNLRYQYSLVKIRTREFENGSGETWTRQQYNNVISFRLIWVFNEEQSKRVQHENK